MGLAPSARLDEAVPSRSALKVGDIAMLPITAVTLAANADLPAWPREMFLPPETIDWPLNVAAVRSGGRTGLADSGLAAEFPGFPRAGQLATRLVAAGTDPSSVTDVVLTHLHTDHIGGLLVEGLRGRPREDPRFTSPRRRRSSGRRPAFPALSCRSRSRRCCARRPRGSLTCTAAVRNRARGDAGRADLPDRRAHSAASSG
ncbi:MBL fold metallo-hydrolase [Amycolatopsis rubida]|uniref:Metallo-beta-lactamase superfamily protein n=1 Tax=Amycolatopsis rubida TaxID=112413 RepID=A0A1I5RMH3_9PSEU|nr:MBL fold metallo-hydrolase [Amycolatopsis rubida]SFP59567.1 Metallo-beta-lactamase superfamily protein [Amycolatopsis rubida]